MPGTGLGYCSRQNRWQQLQQIPWLYLVYILVEAIGNSQVNCTLCSTGLTSKEKTKAGKRDKKC